MKIGFEEVFSESKMKVFQTIQKQFAILGISSPRPPIQKYPFNERIYFGFLLFGCSTVSKFVYIFHVASGFIEYVECVSVISGSIIIIVCFGAIVFRKSTIFESVDLMEKLLDASESPF